jgi:hypothetical protein
MPEHWRVETLAGCKAGLGRLRGRPLDLEASTCKTMLDTSVLFFLSNTHICTGQKGSPVAFPPTFVAALRPTRPPPGPERKVASRELRPSGAVVKPGCQKAPA